MQCQSVLSSVMVSYLSYGNIDPSLRQNLFEKCKRLKWKCLEMENYGNTIYYLFQKMVLFFEFVLLEHVKYENET